jgi:large subunit ribosomal protein L22e
LDASKPVADGIFDIAAFEKFLHDRIKVEGRTGNLTESVAISRTSNSVTIAVGSSTAFAKRYIKYLTKKFLKKNQLRDFMRVVASSKSGYELRYFNIGNDKDEEEEEDDE